MPVAGTRRPPLQSGGQNQKWPTCGQGGYVTPAASGDPHRFRAGGGIRGGAQKRAELLRNSCFLGDPQKGGIDMAHFGPGQKEL